MTEEQKKAAPEADESKAEAEEQDEEATEDESEGDSEDEAKSNKNIDIDYKAIAETERKKREDAERVLAEGRYKNAQKKRLKDESEDEEQLDDEEEDDEDRPLTRREYAKMMQENNQRFEKQVQASRIADIAKSIARNADEASAIVEIHKNRTFPAYMPLEQQMNEAFLIANSSKILGEHQEALRALRGKNGVVKNPAAGHRDGPLSAEPKMAGADIQAIKDAGFNWNGTSKSYEKKLSNGDILRRDPKTKATIRIPKR